MDAWDELISNSETESEIIKLANSITNLSGLFQIYHVDFQSQDSSSGWTHLSHCPFPDHNDSDPSFGFNPDKNCWNCFGCHRGGQAVQLVSIMENLSPLESAKKLLENVDSNVIVAEVQCSSSDFFKIKDCLVNLANELRPLYQKSFEKSDISYFMKLENLTWCLHIFLTYQFSSGVILEELQAWIEKLRIKIND